MIVGILLTIKNASISEVALIKDENIETTLDKYFADIKISDPTLSEEGAKKRFLKHQVFSSKGEVLLLETVERNNITIKFYSDGTAIKINNTTNMITRIAPLKDGSYGVDKGGTISSKAKTSIVTKSKTTEYPWGTVTYYSDGSAEISNSKMDIFVRDAKDINENYISDNKVSYLKESKVVGTTKLNYYYDGSIEVIKDNKSYMVRTEDDLIINGSNVTFKNNNQAAIINTKKMDNGMTIDYYEDGGAIINDGERTISVRKSNSIIIKNNNIYEIVDNIYVEISKETKDAIYYTNGGAVVKFGGETYYVDENSSIKYQDDKITDIGENKEKLSNESGVNGENVKTFEKTAVVTTKDYIAIIPKEQLLLDQDGKVKKPASPEVTSDEDDDSGINSFEIINNTNSELKYRVVIEKSPKTTVDVQYLRYMLSTKSELIGPSKLDSKIMSDIKTDNITYILIEDTIDPQDSESISIMLWTDYDTIPNSMQNKYFYGTIRVYAWSDETE